VRRANGKIEIGHCQSKFLSEVSVSESVGMQADRVIMDGLGDGCI